MDSFGSMYWVELVGSGVGDAVVVGVGLSVLVGVGVGVLCMARCADWVGIGLIMAGE